MDIYGYLKAENSRLFDLIETIVESSDRALQNLLLAEFHRDLAPYLACKSRVFYTACGEHALVDAFADHTGDMLAALEAIGDGDDTWPERLGAFRLALLRHFDEEEHDVFHLARHRLKRDDARRLHDAFLAEREGIRSAA
ncbi:MAG: hypothetical protein WDN06_09765 [Asticcacaulis sp.]